MGDKYDELKKKTRIYKVTCFHLFFVKSYSAEVLQFSSDIKFFLKGTFLTFKHILWVCSLCLLVV